MWAHFAFAKAKYHNAVNFLQQSTSYFMNVNFCLTDYYKDS
ncbi:hypothetical protein NMS_0499 [Nonlabens marinus S1-08]|uniref:Uncharacterized protein n=1 Tax=Nonlabens marinus S1-08 TaxID=1454201 RepID=W8VUD6_9FLAO|nr:hypothetical protein NMS_0499 [Nonlabens marinus S1-08]